MKKNTVWIFVLVLNMIGCAIPEIQNDCKGAELIRLNPEVKSKISINEIVKKTKYIPLETKPECLIGKIHCIKSYQDKYFIHNNQNVFCFNQDGAFLGQLGSLGHGPDQYTSCDQFFINESTGNLFISNHESGRDLLVFDSTLQFVTKKRYAEEVESILPISDDGYCFYLGNRFHNSHDYFVNIVNKELKPVREFIEKREVINHSITSIFHGSYLYNNKAHVFPMFENVIYEVGLEECRPKYRFDFGEHNIPKDFLNQTINLSPRDQFDKIRQAKYVYSIDRVFESHRWLFFTYASGTMGLHTVFYNKHTKDVFDTSGFSDMAYLGMMSFPYGMTENEIIFTLEPFILHSDTPGSVEFQNHVFPKNSRIKNLKEATEIEGNPILVVATLK